MTLEYVGVCYDSGAWGGALTGLLVVREDGVWVVAASHISSSDGWARVDISRHYDRLSEPGATFEWAGLLTIPQLEERFGWGAPDA